MGALLPPVLLRRIKADRIDLDYLEMTDLTWAPSDIWVNLTDVNGNPLTIQQSGITELQAMGYDTSRIPAANIVKDGG